MNAIILLLVILVGAALGLATALGSDAILESVFGAAILAAVTIPYAMGGADTAVEQGEERTTD
ncbi:hypothetical protein [Natronococcus sp.]|uniref:hypothetical protein n=1 Tax=Natronococcus sp. TaxID=35747 RepID=UPI0025F43D4A|nr:hypothetical protein [Natronococcus sp.]